MNIVYSVYVCMSVSMHSCMCACVFVSVNVCAKVSVNMCTQVFTHAMKLSQNTPAFSQTFSCRDIRMMGGI